ncbi:spore germination protein [Bacillus halotolerans]|uniref:spore germination protein n=1 Tax=Bacillus halotolerans TaxID=260554 RepID=UPI00228104C9|nr:spore germination protein [Bacillus halotolerans]MCY8977898.1 spore germination protein [Bacillus halotolerans]MEC1663724.1 spore germination protein [Bacillus halotolerans]
MKNRSPSPSEGFTESLRVNTALVRFRVKSLQLKTIAFKIGPRTKTDIVLAYIGRNGRSAGH